RPFALLPPTVVSIFDVIGPAPPIEGSEDTIAARRVRLLWRIAMQLSLHTAAHVITASEAAMQDLRMTFGVPSSKLTVVPLAVDERFRPQPESAIATLRQKYDLPRQYVLYLGSNKPHKNIGALVDAWANLLRNQSMLGSASPTALVIAGHVDPRYSLVQKRTLEHGMASTVRFLPDVVDDDLPALLSGALCFVFPSLHEGFGLPPLEAMACGTPVIASNRTSLPEVVGDAGLLVDPEPEALAAAIARLVGDAGLRLALRERGLERAAAFSWKWTATETLRVYREVAR
ncbi:MAG TPA: glycosyltransferase family 1 protein, partial [Herpetosiphonaceae bacterium]|nr:glycosyltransferase family 1 protein [Herpetosiphonaceae bacterium]